MAKNNSVKPKPVEEPIPAIIENEELDNDELDLQLDEEFGEPDEPEFPEPETIIVPETPEEYQEELPVIEESTTEPEPTVEPEPDTAAPVSTSVTPAPYHDLNNAKPSSSAG